MLLARLKTHNPRLGYVKGGFGMPKCKRPDDPNKDVLAASLLFKAGEAAVEVTPEDAAILREVREVEGNNNSPLAFDVWNPAVESEPPLMAEARDDRGGGLSSRALNAVNAAFVPRSEIDGMIARAVAQALAAHAARGNGAAAKAPEVAATPAAETPSEPEESVPATPEQALEDAEKSNREKMARYFPAKGGKK
jgi:hypothetical protein